MKSALRVLIALVLPLAAVTASAHYPWISVHGAAGQDQTFRIHFGHAFSEDALLRVDQLEGVRVVHSDGSVETFEIEEREHHPLPGASEGARMVVVEQKSAYWSRTYEGGRRASREQYPDAFSCNQSVNSAKAVAGAGPGVAWQHRQGHALELVPLNDPAALRGGDPLAVQVLLHGEPWEGEVRATYAGYAHGAEDEYAVTVRTGVDGIARLVPAVAADWLMQVHASEDYPDPAVCDRRSYHSTLTFTVR